MTTTRQISGLRYTQADAATRDQRADEAQVLAANPNDHDALVAMHALGYDCSTARVTR